MTAAEIRAMLRKPHTGIGQCDDCERDTELWDNARMPGDPLGPMRCRSCWKAEALKAAAQGRAIGAQVVRP